MTNDSGPFYVPDDDPRADGVVYVTLADELAKVREVCRVQTREKMETLLDEAGIRNPAHREAFLDKAMRFLATEYFPLLDAEADRTRTMLEGQATSH